MSCEPELLRDVDISLNHKFRAALTWITPLEKLCSITHVTFYYHREFIDTIGDQNYCKDFLVTIRIFWTCLMFPELSLLRNTFPPKLSYYF